MSNHLDLARLSEAAARQQAMGADVRAALDALVLAFRKHYLPIDGLALVVPGDTRLMLLGATTDAELSAAAATGRLVLSGVAIKTEEGR